LGEIRHAVADRRVHDGISVKGVRDRGAIAFEEILVDAVVFIEEA
jgi:hypothetical protein